MASVQPSHECGYLRRGGVGMLTMWRIGTALLICLVAANAYSNPPSPTPPEASQKPQSKPKSNQDKAASDQRSTEQLPIIIKELPPTKIQEKSSQIAKERESETTTDRWLMYFTGGLLLVGLLQLIVFGLQAWKLHQTVKATKESADAALKTAQNMEVAERAYVKMSHTEPGVLFDQNQTARSCEVTVKVENCGRTPAAVTDVRLNACLREWGAPLPTTPDYGQPYPHGAPFLVPGDFFFWGPRTFPLGRIDSPNPYTREIRLCLFGYVDYIDVFDQRHRAGYAREYRAVQGNNLFFISEPGYNYDHQREPDEGNDWDDPASPTTSSGV